MRRESMLPEVAAGVTTPQLIFRRFSSLAPLVPTYVTSSSQSDESWYWVCRFHCIVYGVRKFGSMTVRPIGAIDEKSKCPPRGIGVYGNGCAMGASAVL